MDETMSKEARMQEAKFIFAFDINKMGFQYQDILKEDEARSKDLEKELKLLRDIRK